MDRNEILRELERTLAESPDDAVALVRYESELARRGTLAPLAAKRALAFVRAVNGGRRSRTLALAHVAEAIGQAAASGARVAVACGADCAAGVQVTTDANRAPARADTAALTVYRTPEAFVLVGRVVTWSQRYERAVVSPEAARSDWTKTEMPDVQPSPSAPVLRLSPLAAAALVAAATVHHTKWGKTAKHGQTPECERAKPRRQRVKLPEGTPMSGMRDEVTCFACLRAGIDKKAAARASRAPQRETWRYDVRGNRIA